MLLPAIGAGHYPIVLGHEKSNEVNSAEEGSSPFKVGYTRDRPHMGCLVGSLVLYQEGGREPRLCTPGSGLQHKRWARERIKSIRIYYTQ